MSPPPELTAAGIHEEGKANHVIYVEELRLTVSESERILEYSKTVH